MFDSQPNSTRQTHGFWMKVRKDLIYISMPENVSKHFGEHGTIVEENFETAWARYAQGVCSRSLFLREARPPAVDLSPFDTSAHGQHGKAPPVISAQRAILVDAASKLGHHQRGHPISIIDQVRVKGCETGRKLPH